MHCEDVDPLRLVRLDLQHGILAKDAIRRTLLVVKVKKISGTFRKPGLASLRVIGTIDS